MIEIASIEKEKIVHLKTTSDYSNKDVDGFLKTAIEFAKQHDCYRIILDHRNCRFRAGTMDIYNITRHLDKYGFNAKYKGAVVYDQDYDKYEFADTVSHNWSMGVLRFFDDINTAKQWLLE